MTTVMPPRTRRTRVRRVTVRRIITGDPIEYPSVPTIGGPWTARTEREALAMAVGYAAGVASMQRDLAAARWQGREDFAAEILPAIRWAWGADLGAPTPEAQRAAWNAAQKLPWRDIRDRHLRALDAVAARRRWSTSTDVPRPGDKVWQPAA